VEVHGPDPESSAILAIARRLRCASAQRERFLHPLRDRFDRSERDPRLMPERRDQIATAFVLATYRADHVYEDYLDRTLGTAPDLDRR